MWLLRRLLPARLDRKFVTIVLNCPFPPIVSHKCSDVAPPASSNFTTSTSEILMLFLIMHSLPFRGRSAAASKALEVPKCILLSICLLQEFVASSVLATKQIEMTTTKNSTSKTKGFRVFFGHGREWLPQLVYGIKGMPRYLTISVSLDYVYPFFSNFKFLSKKSGEKRGLGSIFVARWFLSCRMNRRFDSWLKTKLCPGHIPFSTSNCFEPSIYSTEASCCVNLKDDMAGQSYFSVALSTQHSLYM
nr:hypothetical protein Iba_chr13cCG16730 [Ipomoea batatas]